MEFERDLYTLRSRIPYEGLICKNIRLLRYETIKNNIHKAKLGLVFLHRFQHVVGLVTAIGKSLFAINQFRQDVLEARRDLLRVASELTSLQTTIEGLKEDFVDDDVDVPSSLQDNVLSIVTSCSKTVNDMEKLLLRLLNGNFRRKIEWAVSGKPDMDKLRSNLEAHKMSLNIAIDMLDLSITREIKRDTTAIKETTEQTLMNTNELKEGHARIVQGIEHIYNSMAQPPTYSPEPSLPRHQQAPPERRAYAARTQSTTISNSESPSSRIPTSKDQRDDCEPPQRDNVDIANGQTVRKEPVSETSSTALRWSLLSRLDSRSEKTLQRAQNRLENGANPNQDYDFAIRAVEMADVPLLELLLAHRLAVSQVHVQKKITSTVKDLVDISSDFTTSLILVACGHHHYSPVFSARVVKLLLDHRSDVNSTTSSGWTPLMFVCDRQQGNWQERLRIAELLLDHGAKADAKRTNGKDCLYFARKNKSKEFEKLILSRLPKS